MNEKANEFAFDEFRLDPANALLWRDHDRIALPPKPFEVLCCLVKRAGQLVTKDELLDAVWPNLHDSESSLSFSINAVRIALGDDAKAPRYIETVTQRGYRFIAPVTVALRPETGRRPEGQPPAPQIRTAAYRRCWVGRAGPLETLEICCSRPSPAIARLFSLPVRRGSGRRPLSKCWWSGCRDTPWASYVAAASSISG